jgi:hypothetical protein
MADTPVPSDLQLAESVDNARPMQDPNNVAVLNNAANTTDPAAPDLGNPTPQNPGTIPTPNAQPQKPQRQSLVDQILGGPTQNPLKNIFGHFLVGAAAGPGGGGFAGGFARGAGAGLKYDQQQQDRANAKKQQDFENQQKTDEADRRQKESEAHISLATQQKMESEQRMKHQDLEDFQSAATEGKHHVDLATAGEGNIVARDQTLHEVGDLMSKNKDTDLFHGATYEMTGYKPVLDATGKISGYEPTYTVYKPDANVTLDKQTADDFSKNVAGGNLNFKEGQVMPREQFERMRGLAQKGKADQFTQDKNKADLEHIGAQTKLAGAETDKAKAEANKANAEAAAQPSKAEAKLNGLLDKEYTGIEQIEDPVSGSKTTRKVLGTNASAALPQINKEAKQFGIQYKLSPDGKSFVVDNGDHVQLKSGNSSTAPPNQPDANETRAKTLLDKFSNINDAEDYIYKGVQAGTITREDADAIRKSMRAQSKQRTQERNQGIIDTVKGMVTGGGVPIP